MQPRAPDQMVSVEVMIASAHASKSLGRIGYQRLRRLKALTGLQFIDLPVVFRQLIRNLDVGDRLIAVIGNGNLIVDLFAKLVGVALSRSGGRLLRDIQTRFRFLCVHGCSRGLRKVIAGDDCRDGVRKGDGREVQTL